MFVAMEASRLTRVKVCCMKSDRGGVDGDRGGASAIGLVSPMPSGRADLEREGGGDRRAGAAGIDAFLLTPLQTVEELVEQNRVVKARTLQLVDELPEGAHAELRRAMPGVKLVQVIHVQGRSLLTTH